MEQMNFKADIILENDRLKLEPLGQHHFSFLLPVALDYPDLLKYSPSPFGTENFLQQYIDTALEQREQNKRYAFAIYDKQKSSYAGSTSFGEVCNKNKRLQIGWTWMGKDFQRTGLNRNCKFLMLSYAFEQLEFRRVEFVTDARNLQSQNAIEAIGGRFEGELRSHVVMADGFRRNSRFYSILLEEWDEIKKEIFEGFSRMPQVVRAK